MIAALVTELFRLVKSDDCDDESKVWSFFKDMAALLDVSVIELSSFLDGEKQLFRLALLVTAFVMRNEDSAAVLRIEFLDGVLCWPMDKPIRWQWANVI